MAGLDDTKAVKINSKVGTLTADEIVFAGGSQKSSLTYYLKDNATELYWTMSPFFWVNAGAASVWSVKNGVLINTNEEDVRNSRAVRPVLVLKSDVEITSGNGTQENPYIID